MRERIPTLSSPREVIHFAQSEIGFEHRGHTAHEGKFTALYEAQLRAEFPQFADTIDDFADSPLSVEDTIYEHRGRPVSNVLFFQARTIMTCLAYLQAPQTVCEIGGGYGGPARLWLSNPISKPRTYVIVDVPECLFFAEVFLSAQLPRAAVHYVQSDDATDLAAAGASVILCPLDRMEALQHLAIDLVINTGSMQEMTEEWVDLYASWLDRQQCNFFYSLNYFAQSIHSLAEGANLWAPRLSDQWIHRLQRFNPHWVRLQTERNFAEIVAERTGCGALDGAQARTRAARLIEERFFDGALLLELIDLYRRSRDPSVALDILSAARRCSTPHAKELLYLVDRVLSEPAGPDARAQEPTLRKLRETLCAQRAQGRENLY